MFISIFLSMMNRLDRFESGSAESRPDGRDYGGSQHGQHCIE
jgi:hypothetical protein